MFDYTREHENDFSFWYPKIKDCGIPTPLTFYTKLPSAEEEPEYAKRLYEAFYMEHPKEDEEVVKAYLEERVIPKLKEMGLTGHVFVKNGRFSNKFNANGTCNLYGLHELYRAIILINYEAICCGAEGADEIVFYDITASAEERGIFLDVVERVASQIFIPFSVGGGISSVADMRAVLNAGAEKVSINSAAVRNPDLVADGAAAFGSQAIVVGMDVLRVPVSESIPSGYEIVIQGGRRRMGIDAIEWARQCQELGAGELCVNSIDADGTRDGYELTLTRAIVDAVSIPVIASGGAGAPEHMYDAVSKGGASAALIASIVHYGQYTIRQCKEVMAEKGAKVRLTW